MTTVLPDNAAGLPLPGPSHVTTVSVDLLLPPLSMWNLSRFSRAVGLASRHRPLSHTLLLIFREAHCGDGLWVWGYGERCDIDGTCFLVTIVEEGWQAETAIDTEL